MYVSGSISPKEFPSSIPEPGICIRRYSNFVWNCFYASCITLEFKISNKNKIWLMSEPNLLTWHMLTLLGLFIPKASFGIRFLSLPASFSLSVCVYLWVCRPPACACDDSLPIQTRIKKSNKRCKTPWLRSLLLWALIDLDPKGQILLTGFTLVSKWNINIRFVH